MTTNTSPYKSQLFSLYLHSGIGLSFTQASLFAILPYHFEHKSLHMAIAGASSGFFAGYLLVPVPASYLFTRYGFNVAMFLASSVMLLHLLGMVFYSQGETVVRKDQHSKKSSLKDSLKQILSDSKVLI